MPILQILLSNWKVIATALICVFLSTMWHNAHEIIRAEEKRVAVEEAIKITEQKCEESKKITEAISNDLSEKLNDLNSRADAYKLRGECRCPVQSSKTASRGHAAKNNKRLLGPYGLDTGELYNYATDAEKTGLKLDALQEFIRQTWVVNK